MCDDYRRLLELTGVVPDRETVLNRPLLEVV